MTSSPFPHRHPLDVSCRRPPSSSLEFARHVLGVFIDASLLFVSSFVVAFADALQRPRLTFDTHALVVVFVRMFPFGILVA